MATSNTIFSNYHPNGHHINPSLLWEYDMSTFAAMLHKKTVETSTNLLMVQGNFNWSIIANRLNDF